MHQAIPFRVYAAFCALLSVVLTGVVMAYRADSEQAATAWEAFETPLSAEATRAGGEMAPQRIIALSLAAEEVILDLAGSPILAAVSPWARDAKYSNVATKTESIQKTVNAQSLELILRLRPDCVFAASYTDPRARRILRRVKIPVVQLPEPRSLENVRQALTLIGATLAREAETLAMRKRFDALLERTRERAAQGVARRGGKPPEVLYVGTDLNTPWTAGQNTLADEILQAAGAVNVAARHGVVHEAGLNKEAVLRWEPEILLFDGEPSRRDERLQELEDDRLFAGLRAVREGNVILIPARLITAASHYAAPAAELLCNALYGEAEGP